MLLLLRQNEHSFYFKIKHTSFHHVLIYYKGIPLPNLGEELCYYFLVFSKVIHCLELGGEIRQFRVFVLENSPSTRIHDRENSYSVQPTFHLSGVSYMFSSRSCAPTRKSILISCRYNSSYLHGLDSDV